MVFKDGKRAYLFENVIKSEQIVMINEEQYCDDELDEDQIEERERIHETMFSLFLKSREGMEHDWSQHDDYPLLLEEDLESLDF